MDDPVEVIITGTGLLVIVAALAVTLWWWRVEAEAERCWRCRRHDR